MSLPPDPLPARPEPDGTLGPYAHSSLRTVTGTRINPLARDAYVNPDHMGALTCANPELGQFLHEIGGYDPRARLAQPPVNEWPMSRLIPRVHLERSFPRFPMPAATYAIDYMSMTQSATRFPVADWVNDIRDTFPENSRLLLNFTGNNAQCQYIWSVGPEFWQQPWLSQFDAIITPEFSTFINDPVPQWLAGERYKQIFATEGYEAGHTIIPSVAWSSDTSLRRQLELWCSMYPQVNTVWLDLLGAGVESVSWTWSRLAGLERWMPRDVPMRWLVSGAISGWAIAELMEILPHRNFHTVNIRPFANAVSRPGTSGEKAQRFRAHCMRIEHWFSEPPARETRPELPDDLLG